MFSPVQSNDVGLVNADYLDKKIGQWRSLQDLGFSSSDIKLITGHAEEGAFAHYSHGDSLPIKERLLKAWETEVLRLVQQRQAEK